MAFKPVNANKPTSNADFEPRNFPVPKGGNRKARVSLIVDLGVQNRPDVYELDGKLVNEDTDGAVAKPQKPCQQVAVFADLVNDVVDYGGDIGEAQYRLMLNKSFQGTITGINFTATPPKDAKGKTIEGKPWGLHPTNMLTKLAKAVGKEEVITDMDLEVLLDQPFMAEVSVKITQDKNGKKDKDGNVIEYKNVSFKGASPIPLDDDDQPMKVAKLQQPARCITFDDATVEDIKFLRGNLIKMIKQANNYAGSAMQKAIEAFEASRQNDEADDEEQEEKAPAPKKAPLKAKASPKPPVDEEEDEDVPF